MEMATNNSLWVEAYRPTTLENYIGKELDRLYGVSLFNKIFKDYRSFGG